MHRKTHGKALRREAKQELDDTKRGYHHHYYYLVLRRLRAQSAHTARYEDSRYPTTISKEKGLSIQFKVT